MKFKDLSGLGLVMRTPTLKEHWLAIKAAETQLHRLIGEIDRERSYHAPLGLFEEKYEEALKPIRRAVIDFREAAEQVIF